MPRAKPDAIPSKFGEPYTEEEIIKAIEMKDAHRMTWPEVGERLGRSHTSLAIQVHRYRRGRLRFLKRERDRMIDEIVQEIIAGNSMRSCARKHGLIPSSLHRSMLIRGWDQETIQEMRKGEIRV